MSDALTALALLGLALMSYLFGRSQGRAGAETKIKDAQLRRAEAAREIADVSDEDLVEILVDPADD